MDDEKSRGGLRIPSHTLTRHKAYTGLLNGDFWGAERPVDARFAPTGAERRLVVKEPCYAVDDGQGVT